MEIRVYDENLYRVGQLENQTSLIWTRRFFECGEFELHAPITEDNIRLFKKGNLIKLKDHDECGVIEDLDLDESKEENKITATGRFATKYLDQRVLAGAVNVDTTVELAMRQLFNTVTPFSTIELGDVNGFNGNVTGQFKDKNLLSSMIKLAKYGNIGFKLIPDFAEHKWTLVFYQGKDKSMGQSTNKRVIFSEKYDNLNEATYHTNDQSYYNVAYVRGKDKNENEVLEIVGDTELTDIERREIFVDGTNISQDELSDADFRKALRQEGQNTLNLNVLSESFECNTNATGNFEYKVDYDLGDIVTCNKKGWNVARDLRITEIEEVYEKDSQTITPTFGNPLPTSIDWED